MSNYANSHLNAITHGMSHSREYSSWVHMRERCYRKSSRAYKNYGAKGIIVCKRWRNSFENFISDMGRAPPGTMIDRKKSGGNYTPKNCRWATRKEQNRNTNRNRFIIFHGDKRCISGWSEIVGISKTVIRWRIHNGWSPRRALMTPKARRISHV